MIQMTDESIQQMIFHKIIYIQKTKQNRWLFVYCTLNLRPSFVEFLKGGRTEELLGYYMEPLFLTLDNFNTNLIL